MATLDLDSHIDGPRNPDGLPTIAASGVDLTLIREELRRTPAERLQALRDEVAAIERLAGSE